MLQAVALVGREAGLEINVDKTKVLVVGDLARTDPSRTLSVDGMLLERVQNFQYLGTPRTTSPDESIKPPPTPDDFRRCGRLRTKTRIYRALSDPILFYA